jgi:YVTN family beta-propeller protein
MITSQFPRRRLLAGMGGLGVTLLAAACGEGGESAPRGDAAGGEASAGDTGEILIFSNTSPHVTAIDILTEEVSRTGDIDGLTTWAWNDDNNFFDGRHLWLGTLNAGAAELITLDVDALTVTNRIPLGSEADGVFLGKARQDGSLLVSKMAAGEVLTVNTTSYEVTNTFSDIPLHGGVLADADLSTDGDGVERFVYPTAEGDRVVALDPSSGAVLATAESKTGGHPTRLTTSPDGSIWVQEAGKHSVAVYEPTALELVKRFQAGTAPILGTFTPDGAYAYTGHADDNFVQVVDTANLRALAHIRVGLNPQMVAVRPDFSRIYAMLTDDQAVAVVYQQDWEVNSSTITSTKENSIALESPPVGMFLRMTSVGGRLRDSAERAEACKISYACGTQNIGTKR